MAIYTNLGLDLLTRHNLGIVNTISLVLHLYSNNWTPGVADLASNYVECVVGGYAPVALTPSSWVGNTVNGLSSYSYPTQTFTFNAGNGGNSWIFGWYLQDAITFTLIAAELLNPAYPIPAGGGNLQLTLAWGEGNC